MKGLELFFFVLLFFGTLALLAIGLHKGNFPFVIIGTVLLIVLGLLVLTEGLTTQKIVSYTVDDTNASAPTTITPLYTTETVAKQEIWILGNLMFWGGLVFLLFSAYYAMFGNTGAPDDVGGGGIKAI